MKKILLFSFVLITFSSIAQDWAPFKTTDTIRHYVAENTVLVNTGFEFSPIQSVSVDTIINVNNRLIFKFEKGFSVEKISHGNNHSDLAKGRILGDTILFYQDSLIVSSIDTFGFRLKFPFNYYIGQTFNFANSVNFSIQATCDSIYFNSIGNGQMDSIAKISLTVFDQNSNPAPNHPFNGNYEISKTFGLTYTRDFTNLQDSLAYFKPYSQLNQKLKCNTTVDLNVGDEYHFTLDSNLFPSTLSNHWVKRVLVSDTTIGTLRTVRFVETKRNVNSQNGVITTRPFNQTYDTSGICHFLKSAIIPDSLLDFNQTSSNELLPIYGLNKSNSLFPLIKTYEFSSFIIDYNPVLITSWPPIIDSLNSSTSRSTKKFQNIIGLSDHYDLVWNNGNGLENNSKIIHYIKKGNQTWGIPLNLSVGIDEVDIENQLQLYPNPVQNQLNFSNNLKIEKAVIFDLKGKEIMNFRNENSIDVSELKSGIYFIRANTSNSSFTQKFVKE